MVKYFFSSMILAFLSLTLSAQTIKTGVLVIGNTAPGFAASIQSARSGAKTVFLTQTPAISPDLTSEDITYLEKIQNYYRAKKNKKKSGTKDSIVALDLKMNKDQYSKLIKGISDTTKNLTVILNSPLEKIEKDGKGWEIRLKNGQKIKTEVVVDATENLFIASVLRIDANKTMLKPVANPFDTKLYRSTVATAYTGTTGSISVLPVSLGSFLPAGIENFIIVPKSTNTFKPVNMSVGQAAGTIASYCAFFKTTTKNINVRAVQTELLTFDAHLIPLSDIQVNDPNFQAFQRMALSGLLKPVITKDGHLNIIKFDTAGTFSSEQLRAPMREYYSRSQLWFADNKKDVMTIEDAISLFMFTATRGNELTKEIEDGWKESFKFDSKFDLKRPITRKEFAILADEYLLPFKTRVDFAGNLLS